VSTFKEAIDKATGKVYWYNPQTKETTWTRPKQGAPRKQLAIEEAHTPMWYWALPLSTFGAYAAYLYYDSSQRPDAYDNARTDKPSQISARMFCPIPEKEKPAAKKE